MRINVNADLLKTRFQRPDSWEQGRLYLVQADESLELAVGVIAPGKDGPERHSACVILTGKDIGELVLDDIGETRMMAVPATDDWNAIRFVLNPRPADRPIEPGAIGLLRARESFYMLLQHPVKPYKYAYLNLAELRIRDSNESLELCQSLVRIEHPLVGS